MTKQTTLKEAIESINFNNIKETYKRVKIKVKDIEWLDYIEFEYCDATTIYDKAGFTYCLNLKHLPFHSWPMRNANYIQTYKSVKRMLNSLYKDINPETVVEV